MQVPNQENHNDNSSKLITFDAQQESSSKKPEPAAPVSHHKVQQRHSHYFHKQCKGIKSELFVLANSYNLLIAMVYVLLLATFLYINLQSEITQEKVEVQCILEPLTLRGWDFYQTRNISCSGSTERERNIGCFYNDYNYSLFATLPYELILEEIRTMFPKPQKIKCNQYLYKQPISKTDCITKEFDLVCDRKSFNTQATFQQLGIALGGCFGGMIADLYGRKPVFMVSAALSVIGSTMIPIAASFEMMVIGRTIMGVGNGLALLSLLLIFTELCYNRYRSFLTLLAFTCTHIGTILHDLVFPKMSSWRLRELAAKCPVLIILFGTMFVPESPRWLMVHSKWNVAWKVLQELGSDKIHTPEEDSKTDLMQRSKFLKLLQVFHKSYFQYRLCVAVIITGFACLMHNIVATAKPHKTMQQMQVKYQMLTAMIITLILTSSLLVTFRKKYICCTLFFLLACCFSASFIANSKNMWDISLILAETLSTTLLSVVDLFILEMFPTTHRATASGLSASVNGVVNMAYLYFQHISPEDANIHGTQAFVCCSCFICTLATLIAPLTYEALTDTKEDFLANLSLSEKISKRSSK